MPLEDYLIPKERIKYQSEPNVKHGEKAYSVILTDIRLILYAVRGLFFKNDDVVTVLMTNIRGINYNETGIFIKTGHLVVNCIETQNANGGAIIDLTGEQQIIKALYQRLLPFLALEAKQTVSDIVRERETVREIEIMYCRYCGAKNNARLSNCRACNAVLH